jgi:hypothetical protein
LRFVLRTCGDAILDLGKVLVGHPTLSDWAKEVRSVGNAGAHFDPLDDVSLADARHWWIS